MRVFTASVVPCTNSATSSGATPDRRSSSSAVKIASSGAPGTDGVFSVATTDPASSATITSVNVPPMSTPSR